MQTRHANTADRSEPPRHWRAFCVTTGLALLVQAIFSLTALSRRAEAARSELSGAAAMRFAGLDIALVERDAGQGFRVFVDLQVGERVFRGDRPVYVDREAPPSDYTRRYDGRFVFARSLTESGSFAIVAIDRERSTASSVAYRLYAVNPEGEVTVTDRRLAANTAGQQLAVDLLGRPPRAIGAWPPLAGLLSGGFVFASGWLRRRPGGWPAIGLVCLVGSLASLVGWPIMVDLGLARTLPAVVLALAITLLVAGLAGPAIQQKIRMSSWSRAGVVGAIFAVALHGVFVAAQTSVGALMAPVFRAPGDAGLAPGDLLVQDVVRPALALFSVGILPAVLFGGGFAYLNRRLPVFLS